MSKGIGNDILIKSRIHEQVSCLVWGLRLEADGSEKPELSQWPQFHYQGQEVNESGLKSWSHDVHCSNLFGKAWTIPCDTIYNKLSWINLIRSVSFVHEL